MTNVNRNYKDTIFRMVFKEKKELLALYNAVADRNYGNPNLLEIKTLENAIYMGIKNDVSFMIDSRLYLYEHQSTVCPNIPLRNLLYVADQLQEMTESVDLCTSKRILIPTPEFVTFYNGTEKCPEKQEIRLSESFEKGTENPKLELKVLVLNINPGYNVKLMNSCRTLRDYSLYVSAVREYSKSMSLEEAVECAVEDCIKKDILKEFLRKQKAEVMKVSLYEYDAAKHDRTVLNEGIEIGRKEGIKEGYAEGIRAFIIDNLEDGKSEEIIIEKIIKRFQLQADEAKKFYESLSANQL